MREVGASVGLSASLRRLLGTVLEIAEVGLEPLGTELELEKRRFFDALLLGLLALLMVGVGLALLCAFIILLFWDSYRLASVGVMVLLVLVTAAWLLRAARYRLQNPNGIFEASLAELQRDRAGIQVASLHEHR